MSPNRSFYLGFLFPVSFFLINQVSKYFHIIY